MSFTPGTPVYDFLEAIRKAASQSLSQALGAAWSVEIDTADPASAGYASPVGFPLSASGGLQGNASLRLGAASALLLAQRVLAEPVNPSAALTKDRKEALRKLLQQALGAAASSLKNRFGETRVELTNEGSNAETPNSQGLEVELRASDGSSGSFSMGLQLSSDLQASLSSKRTLATDLAAAGETNGPAATREPNFDLLLGVNLNLTLRFGRRLLPLREILDLSAGSVIELDQEVQEPADLLLGDKLIARGQVVIVDGNYGIQITEVADAGQRIGTL